MDMGGWIEQNQPSPQFEYEQIVIAPAAVVEGPPDLEAMAQELDQMKVEATIDAERTRPGLNGFFAFILSTPLIYIVGYAAEHQEKSFAALTHPQQLLEPLLGAIALGGGLAITTAVAIASHIATRKQQAKVQTFQKELISLGGTPLPERGQPLLAGPDKNAHDAR